MSVIARFEVIPVRDGSMSTAIASALRALDRHPVTYQTTATDTVIEADSVEEILAAVQDAHRAIPEDRVITSVEIDEDRRRPQHISDRVASVERQLGHPPARCHPSAPQQPSQQQPSQQGPAGRRQPATQQPLQQQSTRQPQPTQETPAPQQGGAGQPAPPQSQR